jgi:excisionase family DNA binding protein
MAREHLKSLRESVHDQAGHFQPQADLLSSRDPVWDCVEAARFLKIHPVTVKRLARQGALPAFRIGNRWRFRPSELDAWARSAIGSSHSLRRE